MTPSSPITAALVSVGGSPAPVLHVLRKHRPAHVWYFCSLGSRANADEIQQQLDWHPQARFIEVDRFEELGPCYSELRRKIPGILAETRVDAAAVLVDYTGGTKTMSAALVLAASEMFYQFSYVGGNQREKAGLGVTVDGKERALYQGNPWRELAVREVERARDLWVGLNFGQAAETLRDAGRRSQRKLTLSLADLADALAERHRLDFSGARDRLIRLQKPLELLLDSNPGHQLPATVRAITELCRQCAPDQPPGQALLRELLDNSIRTASQERYDDAAARLYRAMEMQGQLWLGEKTDGLFLNGRCKAMDADRIPTALQALDFCRPDADGKIDLSMEQSFRALHALADPRVADLVKDFDRADAKGKPASRWRRATAQRNSSILAHGVQPIGQDGFAAMKVLATEFLDFKLLAEANPFPVLEINWFD